MAARRLAAAAALAVWTAWLAGPAVLAASPTPTPRSPQPPAQVCNHLPGGDAASTAARAACNAVQAAAQNTGQAVGSAAGQAGQAVVGGAESAFSTWLANGAAWVVQGLMQQVMGSSTTPDLNPAQAASFVHVYGRVVGVALSLSVLLALVGIIEATLTQRPGGYRRVVTGIAVSGIGLGAVPAGTAILLRIVDDLSSYIVAGQSPDVAQGLKAIIQLLHSIDPANGAAAFALTALGLMVCGALLWLELVTRAALIYLFLGVAPLACAAVQWPRLEGVLRHVLFAGLALILSKLVIAIVLAVGFAVLAFNSGLESLLGGMFILLIGALMPFATARVLPLAAEEISLSHQGRMRGLMVSGVGWTVRVVSAVSGGGAPAAGLSLAPAMGSSGSQDPGPQSPGSGSAPGGRSSPRGQPGTQGHGQSGPSAAAAAPDARPGPTAPGHDKPATPPEPSTCPRSRGPEPPTDVGTPPVG